MNFLHRFKQEANTECFCCPLLENKKIIWEMFFHTAASSERLA